MYKLCRTALLAVISFLLIQPLTLFVPKAFAGAPAVSKIKKHKKHKQNKEIILKGHHGKHARRPV